eukprot:TRINITY_DN6187_c0_g1_i2.p2 TRINITY_DN6187_c0_g1~~TRINITY_DN6187_c0_g1_i2.p2  ORF type:complete len:251 (+),score=62.04 TRINITY_DN6187_c0_g1_i2:69-821(+)
MAGMLVFARLPDGSTVPCDIGPADTVQDLLEKCGGSALGPVTVLFGGEHVEAGSFLSDAGISSQSTVHLLAGVELKFDPMLCPPAVTLEEDDTVAMGKRFREGSVFTTAAPPQLSTGLYRWRVRVLEECDGGYAFGLARRNADGDVNFMGGTWKRHGSTYTIGVGHNRVVALAGFRDDGAEAPVVGLKSAVCEADTQRRTFRISSEETDGVAWSHVWEDVPYGDLEPFASFNSTRARLSIEPLSGCFRPR